MKKLYLFLVMVVFSSALFSQTYLFQEGFESLPFSFTTTTTTGSDDWTQNSVYFAEGSKSIRGVVPPNQGQMAQYTSISFSTAGYNSVYLRFKHIAKLAPSDQGTLRYIVDNGAPIIVPATDNIYIRPATGGYLSGSTPQFNAACYTDWQSANLTAMPEQTWWKQELFDMSSLIGNKDSVKIVFRISKGSVAGTEAAYGWLLDNIEILASANELNPPTVNYIAPFPLDTIFGTGPWNINAKVLDQSGIASVDFRHRITLHEQTPGSWITTPMTAVNDSIFNFEIPSQPYRTFVEYQIIAKDVFNNERTTSIQSFYNKRPPAEVLIFNDSTASSAMPNPFFQGWTQARVQFIVKAEELVNAGVQAGPLQSIAFNIVVPSPPTANGTVPSGALFRNFSIKGSQTTLQVAPTDWVTGLPELYSAPSLAGIHQAGWNNFSFSSPIIWDGTSNIIFETCFNNYISGSDWGTSATILRSNTPFVSSVSAYTDGADNLCTGANTASRTTQSIRPVIKIGYQQTDFNLDVALVSIIAPTSTMISTDISDVRVRIKNSGVTNLTTADVYWSLNGVVQTGPFAWTGTLFQDQVSSIITLASNVTFPAGNNLVKIWVANPNSGVDLNPNNDTISMSVFVCGGPLAAGTYTVGGASPDFANLTEVQTRLRNCGISGAVVFDIRPGTYYNRIDLPYIQGSTFARTITFKSETNNPVDVIIWDTINTKATVYLDSAFHFRFNHLTLKGGNSSRSRVVELNKNARNIRFNNNIIEGTNINSTLLGYALVYSVKTGTQKDSLLVFENNHFINGSYGLYLAGVSTGRTDSVIVNGNNFSNSYRSLYYSNINGVIIGSNNFNQNTISTQSYSGIYMLSVNRLHRINKNRVTASNLEYGMYLSSVFGQTVAFRGLISNNFIASSGNATSSAGIFSTLSENLNIFYNSINLTGVTRTGSRAIYLSSGAAINLRNNILSNSAGGHSIYVATTPPTFQSDYNNLFSNGTNLAYFSSAERPTMALFRTASQTDSNSVNSNPFFTPFNNPTISEVTINNRGQFQALVTDDIFGTVRSTTTPDIGAVEFIVPAHDLAIIALTTPSSSQVCNDADLPITITIRNNGADTIRFEETNVTFYADADCSFNQNFSLTLSTGQLAPGVSMPLTITNDLDLGSPEVYAFTVWHEWDIDMNRINDTVRRTLDVTKITDFPYDINFTSAPTPPIMLQQLSGTIAWALAQGAQASPTISPAFGTGRLYFNSFTGSGSVSRAMLWPMDFGSLNNPILEFWMSQDNGYATYLNEGVTVRVSIDGGITWTNDTLFARRYNAANTTPGWRRFEMNLANYVGYTCVRIAFDARSLAGNNLSIDRIVVRDLFNNDVKTNFVQTLGNSPVNYGSPVRVRAQIENYGVNPQYNLNVTLNVSGDNSHTETIVVDTLLYAATKMVEFNSFAPSVIGNNTVSVSVANDDNNANNSASYNLISTNDLYTYADTSKVFNYQSNANALLLTRYKVAGTRTVRSVSAYINPTSTIGRKIYGVVLGANGQILAKSDTLTISATDTATWANLPITNWFDAVIMDTIFYAGIAQIGTGYTPIGSQLETPARTQAYYTAPLNGGTLTQVTDRGRLMIGAIVGNLPDNDAQLLAITNPVSGCGLGLQEIKLKIANNGSNDILADELTVWYSVDGATPVSQVIPATIPSGSTYIHTFTPAFDFSTISPASINFVINAWLNLASDPLNHNDSLFGYNVLSQTVPPVADITSPNPLTINYMETAGFTAAIPSGYSGIIKWYINETDTDPFQVGENFTSGVLMSDTSFYVGFHRVDGMGYSDIIGTGTISNNSMPYNGLWDYSWSAMIYKGWEIGTPGTLDSVKFQINSATIGHTVLGQKMYMSIIPDSVFTNLDQPNPANMTLVFEGDVTINNTSWLNIPINGGFNYPGTGHLLIYWENWDGDYVTGYPNFRSTTIANVAKVRSADGAFPAGPATSYSTSRTNVQFFKQTLGCVSELTELVVNVENAPTNDIRPLTVLSPTTQCYLGNESVVVRIQNVMSNEVPAGVNIYCQINGGTIISGTTTSTIAPNGTIDFTIPQTYDFTSNFGDSPYALKVWTSLTEDTYTLNDTIVYNFVSKHTALPLTYTDVDIPYGSSYTFDYPGVLFVYPSETSQSPIFSGPSYTTPILYDTAYYWLEGRGSSGATMDVTIGNGTISNSNIPFNGFYNYSWSAALYKASEIGGSTVIDTIHFQINTATVGYTMNNQKMYLMEINDTVFSSTAPPSTAGMTLVYDGDINITNDQWLSVPLSSNFNYSGSKSLLIYWENLDGSYASGQPTFRATTASSLAKSAISDAGLFSGTPTMSTSRTNIRIKVQSLSCPSDRIRVAVNTTGHPAQDGGVVSYVGPFGGTGYLTATEQIKVNIKNFGTDVLTNFPVSYKVGNNPIVTETYTGTINSGSTVQYTFTTLENLSNILQVTPVKAWTSIANDNFATNDTASGTILPPTYCTITVTSPASYGDIGNVTIANINNGFPRPLYSNPTAVGGYSNFADSLPAIYMVKGVAYPFKATTIAQGTSMYNTTYNVYIDYNKNAVFNTFETMHIGNTPSGSTNTYQQATTYGTITLPDSAKTGYTRMRVVNKEGSDAPACGSYSWGEVEDYRVFIANPATLDASLVSFVSPNLIQSVENTQMPITVKLVNSGVTPITSATIKLIHNSNEYSYIWSGSLNQFQSEDVTIQTVGIISQMNYFTAFVQMTGDEVAVNDTIRTQLFAVPQFDIRPVAMTNPTASICPIATQTITATITNGGVDTLFMSTNNLVVSANVTGAQTANYSTTVDAGFIAPNGTITVDITNTANFSVSGDYTIKIITTLPNDGNVNNDTITATTNVSSIIANLPITENFSTFDPGNGPYPNNWEVFSTTVATAKYRWIAAQGQTLDGADSGPLADHTTGTATGKYMYAYTGNGLNNDRTQLVSQCYNFNRIPGQENEMSYWYHMHGAGIGKLYVEFGSGNTWTTIDSIVGAQQTAQANPWLQKTLPLNVIPDGYYKIRFVAVKGGTNGNIALDDINLSKKLPDVGVTQIIQPVSYPQDSVAYGSQVTVKVRIKNHGNTVVTDIPVAYKPVNSAEVNETFIGTLNPGEDVEFTFATTYTAPSQRTHSLCAYTLFPNDVDSTNNRSCKNVVGYQTDISIATNENGGLFLDQNIPNPAQDVTTINYTLPYSGKVQFRVTDVLGKTLWIEEFQKPNGKHQFKLDVSSYAPGVYFYTLEFDSNKITKKMTIN